MSLDDLAEALDLGTSALYDAAAAAVEGSWADLSTTFNPGQTSIFYDYLLPALEEWLAGAADDWPWVESGDYVQTMYDAYDPEVAESAFSESIEAPVPELEQCIERAQAMEYLADIFGIDL